MEWLDVAQDGDLILVVADKLEIRVHSCVLRLTSKVFKAMLGPDFAEGQTPGTAAEPKRLALPEDDAEDMRLLCLLLHNLNNRLPESLSTDRILRFATLIDKYDCSAAAGPMSRSWLSQFDYAIKVDIDLLCAVYLLDEASTFHHVTESMLCCCTNANFESLARKKSFAPDHAETRTKIIDAMLAKHKFMSTELSQHIADYVDHISELLMPEWEHYKDHNKYDTMSECGIFNPDDYPQKCEYLQHIFNVHLRTLVSAGLWPRKARLVRIGSVLDAIDVLEVIDDRSVMWCDGSCCGPQTVEDVIWTPMATLQQEAKDISTSICLDCLKEKDKKAGTCRVAHN